MFMHVYTLVLVTAGMLLAFEAPKRKELISIEKAKGKGILKH